ncbi:MAG: hypothetical protein GKC08_04330 [Methanosarcinales archaeon]|nr:hypothetical protein [Methanosarcinales archaeon]
MLEVISSSEDEMYYYFIVKTPGFSEFSVAALPFEMEVFFPVEYEIWSVCQIGDATEERVSSSM